MDPVTRRLIATPAPWRSRPTHIGAALQSALKEAIHPAIMDAAEREHHGESVDWPAVYAAIDAENLAKRQRHTFTPNNPSQLLLGMSA